MRNWPAEHEEPCTKSINLLTMILHSLLLQCRLKLSGILLLRASRTEESEVQSLSMVKQIGAYYASIEAESKLKHIILLFPSMLSCLCNFPSSGHQRFPFTEHALKDPMSMSDEDSKEYPAQLLEIGPSVLEDSLELQKRPSPRMECN